MKKSFTLMCILALSINSLSATDYTVEPTTAIKSNTVPMMMNSASLYGSITQQLFFPSEMKDADENTPSAGDITKITFYYAVKDGQSAAPAISRDIEIWLMEIDDDIDAYQYDNTSAYGSLYKSKFFFNANKKAGVKVYDGKLNTNAITLGDGKQSLPLEITPFAWDGESNIVLTLFDKSSSSSQIGTDVYDNLRFYITETTGGRFVHWRWTGSATDDRNTWMNNLDQYGDTYSSPTNTAEAQANTHRYVSLTTFTITPSAAPVVPAVPEDLAVSNVGSTTADLSWTAVDGADSYKLLYSTDGTVFTQFATPSTNSYSWSGLTATTTYYVQVAAVNAAGTSDYSDAVTFTTLAPHNHDDITFEPWSNSSAMPTSGNYYLETDVELAGSSNVTLSGNLNLCLNGHIILTSSNCIIVPDAVTFAIYDNEGTGVIRGAFPGDFANSGLISIKAGGTLSISEGGVVNLADEASDFNYAIDNKGTLNLSGAPTISGIKADIYLANSKYITIESGKPLTNTTPYSVNAVGQTITSGWSNMGEADPTDYFTSAKTGYPLVKLVGGEAKLVSVITLSEASDNSTAITDIDGIESDIRLTRSLTSSQYNTFCLPFALTNAELQSAFGAGYDLQEFVSSSLVDETLELTFNKVTALEAGKPYLLKPSVDVANPIFPNVTITAASPVDQTSDTYISFYGIYSPTELEGGNKNILFLGAENELFWPETTENLKGFRAYFELKGGAAKVAKRARIINKEEAPTSLDEVQGNNLQRTKFIENGQLFILYNGAKYNVQGQVIK